MSSTLSSHLRSIGLRTFLKGVPSTSFPGVAPRTTKRLEVERSAHAASVVDYARKFPKAAPGFCWPCCIKSVRLLFGNWSEVQKVGAKLLASGKTSIRDSEQLGDLGGEHVLIEALAQQGRKFVPENLFSFGGRNCFNRVYFDAPPEVAKKAFILENKGGNSPMGTRVDPTRPLRRVTQLTEAYALVVMRAMASSPDPERRRVGSALLRLARKGQARRKSIAKRRAAVANGDFSVAYLGVRTKYDKTGNRIYEPVITKAIYL